MRGVIRLGDSTSHGGKVITASGYEVNGKKMALVGDLVSCPIPGHGNNPITTGNSKITINGKTAALHGFLAQCGCTVLTSCPNVGEA